MYTKGPWVWINAKPDEGRAGRLFGNGVIVADADPGIFASKDDARLMCYTPLLLEALEAAMDYIDENPCDPDIYPKQYEAWAKLLRVHPRNLIAKAKGES